MAALPNELKPEGNTVEARLQSEFTKWDKIVIDTGKLTVQGFMDAFQAETGLTVTLLFHKVKLIVQRML